MIEDDDETIPEGFEGELADEASISTELPVVVLGDDDVGASSERPRVRLLQGRLHERWVLYPIYALTFSAGAMAVQFALGTAEWSAVVVGLAWFLLYVWYWFYGIAYRYRRRLLNYTSVFVILGLTAALAYFSIDRAQPQLAMVETAQLTERAAAGSLYGAAITTVLAAGLLVVHLVFLGRGYRRKRD